MVKIKKNENSITDFEKYCIDNNLLHLIQEWDSDKNGQLSSQIVSPRSNKSVWWKCANGHEWEAIIGNRTRWSTCPYCSGKKVCQDNCLVATHPNLAAEWNTEKNGLLSANDVSRGSTKKVWWKCANGHEWQATVNSRTTHKRSCPVCLGRVASEDHNLEKDCPDVLRQWNYEKNGTLKPKDVTKGSDKKVWWKCDKGHEWQAAISSKTGSKPSGCPYCSGLLLTNNDLKSKAPKIAELWDEEKNYPITANAIAWKSFKLVWWKCEKGHEWQARISDMTSKNLGCPYCSGKRVSELNRLDILFPEIANEWDYDKNGKLTPKDYSAFSRKKAWWRCAKGHSWESVIGNRTSNGTGCPECNNRSTSFPEQAIFFFCKKYFPTSISRDKDAIGKELDIFIPEIQVGIEYDGKYWHTGDKIAQDKIKDDLCKEKGIRLIRIIEKGLNVIHDSGVVCIKRKGVSLVDLDDTISRLLLEVGVEDYLKGDLINEIKLIREQYASTYVLNNISITNPELLAEWDFEKNGAAQPNQFSSGSSQKVFWKCINGHSWMSSIYSRVGGRGCPYCSGKKVCKDNCLENVSPDVAKEWNYERNVRLTPKDVTGKSGKEVWWKCELGHEWKMAVHDRVDRKNGCPYCYGSKVLTGFNDLQTCFPMIVSEWNKIKNLDLSPSKVYKYSAKSAWWKCNKCGCEWQQKINLRVKGLGCPCCAGKVIIPGYNDLASNYPELLNEWDYEKNGELAPEKVASKSNKKAWFNCRNCGHSWETVIASRVAGRGCPNCSRKHKKYD